MKLTFLGAAREVTGSCTLITANGKNILVDCGMEQGADTYENQPMPMAAGQVDAVLVTPTWIDLPFRYMPYRMFSLVKKLL